MADMTTIAAVPDDALSLAQLPTTVTLSTVGPSGYPQVSAIWFRYEDGVFRTSLTPARQKYKNLVRNPKATLFAIDPEDPFRFLEVRGDATIEPDSELVFLKRLVAHYGVDFEVFKQQAPLDDRVIVTITPTRIRTRD